MTEDRAECSRLWPAMLRQQRFYRLIVLRDIRIRAAREARCCPNASSISERVRDFRADIMLKVLDEQTSLPFESGPKTPSQFPLPTVLVSDGCRARPSGSSYCARFMPRGETRPGFHPSSALSRQILGRCVLFGSDRLWTALPVTGTWGGLPHYPPVDPTYRQKLPFWRQAYDPHSDPRAQSNCDRKTT